MYGRGPLAPYWPAAVDAARSVVGRVEFRLCAVRRGKPAQDILRRRPDCAQDEDWSEKLSKVPECRRRRAGNADGVEELYDHHNDPMEWANLAGDPRYGNFKEELAQWLPKYDAENAPRNTVEKKQGQTRTFRSRRTSK